jgi:hypothetical protein
VHVCFFRKQIYSYTAIVLLHDDVVTGRMELQNIRINSAGYNKPLETTLLRVLKEVYRQNAERCKKRIFEMGSAKQL